MRFAGLTRPKHCICCFAAKDCCRHAADNFLLCGRFDAYDQPLCAMVILSCMHITCCRGTSTIDNSHMPSALRASQADASQTLCCLAIPADMSVANFCSFIGAYLGEVQSIQVGSTASLVGGTAALQLQNVDLSEACVLVNQVSIQHSCIHSA